MEGLISFSGGSGGDVWTFHDTVLLILACVVCAAAQLVKGLTGFGSGLVAIPLLTLIYGPRNAIFLEAVCDVFGGVFLLWDARRQVRWSVVAFVLGPYLVGQWFGTGLLVSLPTHIVRKFIALAVVILALDMSFRPEPSGSEQLESLPSSPRAAAPIIAGGCCAGVLCGFLKGIVGMGGPPVAYFLRRVFHPTVARGIMIAVFLPATLMLCLMLAMRETAVLSRPARLIALVPCALAGGIGGAQLAPRIPRAASARLVGALLMVAASSLAFIPE